ncbi:MAG: hypothetical protein FWD17_02895 [Polyangiaceae bacterium]|nr:hypothetical protein [Polyangiaceae bacterium]
MNKRNVKHLHLQPRLATLMNGEYALNPAGLLRMIYDDADDASVFVARRVTPWIAVFGRRVDAEVALGGNLDEVLWRLGRGDRLTELLIDGAGGATLNIDGAGVETWIAEMQRAFAPS